MSTTTEPDTKELLRLAVTALEAIRENLGLAGFIDAAKGTGMSHLGYVQFLKEAKEALESQP